MAIHLHTQDRGILPKLGHHIVAIYDWLSGPPMTQHERISRVLAEVEPLKQWGDSGL